MGAYSATETTKQELLYVTKMAQSNRLDILRSAKDYIPRALNTLNSQLRDLRQAEILILQRMNRDLTLMDVFDPEKHKAEYFKKIDPEQSFKQADSGIPDPDDQIIYTRNKLEESSKELLREHDRIAWEIKLVDYNIDGLNAQLKIVNKKLTEKGSPDEKDLQKDLVTKRMTAEVFMLWNIHNTYRLESQDEKGNKKYTSDARIVNFLNKLRLKFNAFAERNPQVLAGELLLDLQDPGSDINKASLEVAINRIRSTTTNTKMEKDVKKYYDEMFRNVNDPYVSKRISSKKVPNGAPDSSDSFKIQTGTTAKFMNLTKDVVSWTTQWLYDKPNDAATGFFKNTLMLLNGRKPFCNMTSLPADDQVKIEDNLKQKVVEQEAQKQIEKELGGTDNGIGSLNALISKIDRLYSTPELVQEYAKIPVITLSITVLRTRLISVGDWKFNTTSINLLENIQKAVQMADTLFFNEKLSEAEYDQILTNLKNDYENWYSGLTRDIELLNEKMKELELLFAPGSSGGPTSIKTSVVILGTTIESTDYWSVLVINLISEILKMVLEMSSTGQISVERAKSIQESMKNGYLSWLKASKK